MLAVGDGRDEGRRDALAVVAPGTALRDGLERIVRGNTGALVVLGSDPVVAAICSGGFELDAPFSATRLRELAKMDGAIVVDRDGDRILRAAVQLVPDPRLPTQESGTRHRTAERVARQTGFPVITVSKSMRTIAVFTGGQRYVLEDSSALLARAHQALATLERYKRRADNAAGALTALEIEDRATVRDIAIAAQRLEMAARVTGEIAGYLVELGTDGGLLSMQLDELVAGTAEERALLLRDYAPQPQARPMPTGWPHCTLMSCSTSWPSPRRLACARATAWTAGSVRAATGCSAGSRDFRPGPPMCWSSTSAACRSCCRRARWTCSRCMAWTAGWRRASARAWPGWLKPRCLTGTPDSCCQRPARTVLPRRADGSGTCGVPGQPIRNVSGLLASDPSVATAV